jgi:hypothetical protein
MKPADVGGAVNLRHSLGAGIGEDLGRRSCRPVTIRGRRRFEGEAWR